jgi:hypothetical protein
VRTPGGTTTSVSGLDPDKKVGELPIYLVDHTLGFVTALERMLDGLHYQEAPAGDQAPGMRPLQAHCHRSLGMLYSRIGHQAQTRTELSAAIALYRAMEMTFWLPQTEAALARMEG